MADDNLKLLVNGKSFEGWKGITVKRSIKAIAGSFDISAIDKWADQQQPWLILPGDTCTVAIDKEVIITGYVDDTKPKFSGSSKDFGISGRDKAGDLVDCSIDFSPGTWSKISLLSLCTKVATLFGIGVTLDPTAKSANFAFTSWVVNPGESCFETLERAARLRGVLLANDGQGNIVITRAGTSRAATALVQGQNILSAEATYSFKERFSEYKVKAQGANFGSADPGETALWARLFGLAKDASVKRYRPLVIIAEGAATSSICNQRAQWEAAVRTGKSSPITVTVSGWRQGDGSLWKPNQLTTVKAPWLGINLELLITEVTFKSDDSNAKTTQLLLEPASAYVPDPTLNARKDPYRQLVLDDRSRKPSGSAK